MKDFYTVVFIVVLLFTTVILLYLWGRVWFAFSPFVINYYSSEKRNWYNSWNNDRFLIVLSLAIISSALSLWWGGGRILSQIRQLKTNFTEIIFYIVLHLICFILLELKMDHPFRPISAFREFQKNKYDDRFIFNQKSPTEEQLNIHSMEIKNEIISSKEYFKDEIAKQNLISIETNILAKENNKLLQESDFSFEIRRTSNVIIADVMEEFFISRDSEKVLTDFLLRNKNTGKIIFEKTARNGVSVQPILDFFSKHTNLIESCRNKVRTQAETIKFINEIVVTKDRKGTDVNNPIDSKNLSKYIS